MQLKDYQWIIKMDTLLCRRRNAEQRDNILRELLTTEREYCRDLKLLFQVRIIVPKF